jgi:Zn-dependent alcohol dehydrogenase
MLILARFGIFVHCIPALAVQPGPFGEYPVMPGHEACGVVEFVGSQVQKFKVGDHAVSL